MTIANQQGDVLVIAQDLNTPVPPREEWEIIKNRVLREGKATGHAHRVIAPDSAVPFMHANTMYLYAPEGAVYGHEEHGKNFAVPSPIPHIVKPVQEFDHFEEEAREVLD